MGINTQEYKELEAALRSAFPGRDQLRRMLKYTLNENLEIIGGDNDSIVVFNLIEWAESRGKLSQLISGAYQENPDNPELKAFYQRHYENLTNKKKQPLIARAGNSLKEEDWKDLFEILSPNDFAYLQIAFFRAFKAVHNIDFMTIRPDSPQMSNFDDIQNLLTQYNKPILFVRFVEFALELFQNEDSRDLTAMKDWCDRISNQYNIPSLTLASIQKIDRQGYLLLAFEESGSDVIVYPELRVMEEEKPIEFGVSPVTCSFMEVPDYLSDWINRAEKALCEKPDKEKLLLELFLPCGLLEEDLANIWKIKDKRNKPKSFGKSQMFVVRSFDRIQDDKVKRVLNSKWQLLKDCVSNGNACEKFHLQEKYIEADGTLQALLEDALGLKLLIEFPPEPEDRKDLLYEIIDAAVPIAIWSPSVDEAILVELKTQMNNLSKESQLTNFADLASKWRAKFVQPENEVVKHIRLLCDCPDRLPNLPDPKKEEDLLVA